jgi:transposase
MMLWTAPTLRHRCAKGGCVEAHHIEGEPSMGEVSTIGLDIAKSVFQVHGVDADGAVVIRKRISRAKVLEFFAAVSPCLVGIEACPSAHHWSRKLQALGHTVKLMPPSYVKAYLKRSKNDANDAAAICEAVTRPRCVSCL